MAKYRVLQGIDYPPNKRAEIGDVVEDLPAASVKWLLEIGAIEDSSKPVAKTEPKAEVVIEPVVEPVVEAPVEAVEEEIAFDPNAQDTDGDGFLQDGTVHQRPAEEK